MLIDSHHHLWDLFRVEYPWLMEKGSIRFFGDPSPIQRDYLLAEHISHLKPFKFSGSVHVQVGAAHPLKEAEWIDQIADTASDWKIVQVAFCDLSAPDLKQNLLKLSKFKSLRGVRQIIGRAENEDAKTGTNQLVHNPKFLDGLKYISDLGLSFDLQITPFLYEQMAEVLYKVPDLEVAICHCGSPQQQSKKYIQKWAEKFSVLSERQNTHCKISGLGMFDKNWSIDSIKPIVKHCIDQFGPKRLMFGSNFPVDSLYSDFSTLYLEMSKIIPERHHTEIFSTNCSHFYKM